MTLQEAWNNIQVAIDSKPLSNMNEARILSASIELVGKALSEGGQAVKELNQLKTGLQAVEPTTTRPKRANGKVVGVSPVEGPVHEASAE